MARPSFRQVMEIVDREHANGRRHRRGSAVVAHDLGEQIVQRDAALAGTNSQRIPKHRFEPEARAPAEDQDIARNSNHLLAFLSV